jgi:hypothetical protein
MSNPITRNLVLAAAMAATATVTVLTQGLWGGLLTDEVAPPLGVVADITEGYNAPGSFRYLTTDGQQAGVYKQWDAEDATRKAIAVYDVSMLQILPLHTHSMIVRDGQGNNDTWLARSPHYPDFTEPGLQLLFYEWPDTATALWYKRVTMFAECDTNLTDGMMLREGQ